MITTGRAWKLIRVTFGSGDLIAKIKALRIERGLGLRDAIAALARKARRQR